MAFTSAVDDVNVVGNRRVAHGTFTNTSGSTGGEINTGLKWVGTFVYSLNSHVDAFQVKVVKNSASAGKVTVTTSPDVDADWLAFGL